MNLRKYVILVFMLMPFSIFATERLPAASSEPAKGKPAKQKPEHQNKEKQMVLVKMLIQQGGCDSFPHC